MLPLPQPDAFYIHDSLAWATSQLDPHNPIDREILDRLLQLAEHALNAGVIVGDHSPELRLWLVQQRSAVEYFRRVAPQ